MSKAISIFLAYFIFTFTATCQEVHLYGYINEKNIESITNFFRELTTRQVSRKIPVYYGAEKLFDFDKKDINGLSNLETSLISLSSSKTSFRYTQEEIASFKAELTSGKKAKSRLMTFNAKGSQIPPFGFKEVTQLIEYVTNHRENYKKSIFLLVFEKPRPSISVIRPESGQTVKKTLIEGYASGQEPIMKVMVRVNKSDWKVAEGVSKWSFEAPFKKENNSIECYAVDALNDTSNIVSFANIKYNEPSLWIDFMRPNKMNNSPPKCLQGNSAYCYNFKIKMESSVEESEVVLAIENDRRVILYEKPLDQWDEQLKYTIKKSDQKEICLFFNCENLNIPGGCCMITMDDRYYFVLKPVGSRSKIIKTPISIPVYFESPSQRPGDINIDCICNEE